MFAAINQIGMAGLPLILLAVAIVFFTVKYSIALASTDADTHVDINKIIHLGTFALALGVFSHFLGLYQASGIIAQLRTDQIAAGYGQSLLALLYGFGVFFIAAISWFALRLRMRKVHLETA